MSETPEWQLEAAQGVIGVWENILLGQVRAAREAGDSGRAADLEQRMYAAARERQALAGTEPAAAQAASANYAALIAAHRAEGGAS